MCAVVEVFLFKNFDVNNSCKGLWSDSPSAVGYLQSFLVIKKHLKLH